MGKLSFLEVALLTVGIAGCGQYSPAQQEQLSSEQSRPLGEARHSVTLFSPSVLAESNYDGLCVAAKYTVIPLPNETIDEVARRLNLTGFRHQIGRFGPIVPGSFLYDVSATKLERYNSDRLDQCTTTPIAEEAEQLVYFIQACPKS